MLKTYINNTIGYDMLKTYLVLDQKLIFSEINPSKIREKKIEQNCEIV